MDNSNKLVNSSQIIIILFSLLNLFQFIHAIDNNNNINGTTRNPKGFSLKLIHRNRPNLTEMDATTRKKYIQLSKLRLKTLATIDNKHNKTKNEDPIVRPPMNLDTSMYAVVMEMGMFDPFPSYKTVNLGLDTASDLIWTQCEGCTNCFRQLDPLYPATKSYSYWQLACSSCPPDAQCVNNACHLTIRYGDGAKVESILAREAFRFKTKTIPRTLNDILFGCGIDMQGFHEDDDPNNRISGIFGMSYGERSFHEQIISMSNGKFQYCLQNKDADQQLPPMYLRFGDDTIELPSPITIPMSRYETRPFYYIDLRGIKVDQKILEINPDVFQIFPSGKGGTFIDTGTAVTLLTTTAYKVLENEVAANIESHNSNVVRLRDEDAKFEGFGLCYKRVREPSTYNLPWVDWLFPNGGTFLMNPDVIFEIYTKHDGEHLVCLNIHEMTIEEGGMTVLGSLLQVDHRITYDIPNGKLLVANENCNRGR